MQQNTIIDTWQHHEESGGASIILPDGCRDIIVRQSPGMAPECFLSDLAVKPMLSEAIVGTQFYGFRLQAGVELNTRTLALVVEAAGDYSRQCERIEDNASLCAHAQTCLRCFAQSSGTVEQVAADVGLSMRSLQRILRRATGQPPSFWRLLSRVRKSARALSVDVNLAEHAMAFGYADQPHMNREFQRWFGVSPTAFARHRDFHQQLHAQAFA